MAFKMKGVDFGNSPMQDRDERLLRKIEKKERKAEEAAAKGKYKKAEKKLEKAGKKFDKLSQEGKLKALRAQRETMSERGI